MATETEFSSAAVRAHTVWEGLNDFIRATLC